MRNEGGIDGVKRNLMLRKETRLGVNELSKKGEREHHKRLDWHSDSISTEQFLLAQERQLVTKVAAFWCTLRLKHIWN
jgi:hypothetical protein